MITTSEVAVTLTIDNDQQLDKILNELREIATVEVEKNQSIICIVGYLPKEKPSYSFKVLQSLKDIPLRMVAYGGSTNNISVLVSTSRKNDALIALNEGIFNY
jgi:aspartate kinase